MRAIDADALKRKAQKVATEAWKMKITGSVETVLNQFIDWIDAAPTIDPERKTGRWIRHPEQNNIYGGKCVECSECGEKYVVSYIEDEKHCRNCGAKMEGNDEETDISRRCD